MIAPAPTKNEKSRLAALHALRILDTEPEERFDRVTRLATKLFNVPIALVSLVDKDRQWFKSSIGLDVKETPKEYSFCGHAIHQSNILIVEDTLQDKRFSDNPLVLGSPYIRFYAGQPITSPCGENIGTLCIIDTKSRTLSAEDIISLTDLAALVSDEFVLSQLAIMDGLTQISNRRGFTRLGQHSLDRATRKNNQCHLAYFDLNNFKFCNDNYGHMIGDKVLRIFAQQMKNTFRLSDICARIGGDEFVVLLTDSELVTAQQAIVRFANNLMFVSKHLDLPYLISFAHGIVSFDKNQHLGIEQLVHAADQAMYQDKKNNNNHYMTIKNRTML